MLIISGIVAIHAEPSNIYANAGLAALGGFAVSIAVGIIFSAIEKGGRK